MSQLVANESYKYYKMRLPNTYLISGNIYMSEAAYSILTRVIADEHLIYDAISENQFSTGVLNYLYEIIDKVFFDPETQREDSLVKLKTLLDNWLLTVDLEKSVIH